MKMVFDFIQTSCVICVLSYLLARANFFSDVRGKAELKGKKLFITVAVFLFIALYGFIVRSNLASDMYVDTRIAGIALSGLLFGQLPAFLVTLPTALLSVFLAEQTLTADLLAMLLTFFLSVYCHKKFPDFDAVLSGIIVGMLEVCHMLLIAVCVRPVSAAKEIVYAISFPMIVVNGFTVIAFILIITDLNERRRLWERESFSNSESLVARNIQKSLLDTDFDIDPRLDLSAYIAPAYAVGGDLYSFSVGQGRFFNFIIGDVSGKGVPAAITMSRCEAFFQEIVQHEVSPAAILSSLNRRLCKNNKAQMFVTAFVGSLDLCSGRLLYANAGHVVPYRIQRGTDAAALPRPKGKALGIFPSASYENTELLLEPGQYLLSYSDGITEAENASHELFGSERLERSLSGMAEVSAQKISSALLGAVKEHAASYAQSDDIAIFAVGLSAPAFRYDISADIPAFLIAAENLDRDLKAADVPKAAADDIELVLEELVSNIINYGYPDGRNGKVSISLWTDRENPVILLEDDSEPFDPFAADSPAMRVAPGQREIGGLGIYLTKNRCVEHGYYSDGERNRLMVKLRSSGVKA